jgi:hypothetical protein
MLRAIQAAPGTSVYVTIDGSNLVITTSVPTGATQAAMYRVDPSNNIAVSKSAFDEAGMTSGKFNIAGTSPRSRFALPPRNGASLDRRGEIRPAGLSVDSA